jgi:hypothetical protein
MILVAAVDVACSSIGSRGRRTPDAVRRACHGVRAQFTDINARISKALDYYETAEPGSMSDYFGDVDQRRRARARAPAHTSARVHCARAHGFGPT